MNSFSEVYERVKKYCIDVGKVGEIPLKTWISSLEPVGLDGKNAVFKVQSEFQKTIITNNYEDILKEAFKSILGFDVDIVINIASNLADVKVPTYDELEEKHAELEKSYEFAEYDYTFDTFIEGRSNEFALAACKAVAKNSGAEYNPLFIYGPSGLGKTHLITAIANEIRKNHPEENIVYVTSEVFGSELINAINNKGSINEFHEKYRNADILLIDDIQFFAH